MRSSVLLVASLGVVLAIIHPSIEEIPAITGKCTTGTEYSVVRRKKSAAKIIGAGVLMGMRAYKRLIQGASQVYSDDAGRLYVKSGGYKQAVADFDSVSPTEINESTFVKAGKIGDSKIDVTMHSLLGRPVLRLKRRLQNNRNIIDMFVYKS